MKYVIDSSVAFKWVVPEADSAKARQLRDDYQHRIHELLAPDIFHFEFAHALTRAERQGRITSGQAFALWMNAMSSSPRLYSALSLKRKSGRNFVRARSTPEGIADMRETASPVAVGQSPSSE